LPEGRVWTTLSPFSNLWITCQYATPRRSLRIGVLKLKQAVLDLGRLLLTALRWLLIRVYVAEVSWAAPGALLAVSEVMGSGVS